jgi:hypothetical protein
MTNESPKPSPFDDLRLLGNLCRARLAMEEIEPQIDEEIHQQRSKRTKKSLNVAENKIPSEI